MSMLSQTVWITLLGVSLLFVGGHVLWVYGAQKEGSKIPLPEAGSKADAPLVQWFFLYGAVASFAGIGCLLTAAMMIL
ncbi:MAG: hypothetical protein P4M13_09175 [Alphaproteobacteria bacterium]|nr:hypothetical protein [Alphaproteobacteria bacterium]